VTTAFTTIRTRIEGRVGILTLNRPQVLNAINTAMVHEVGEAMRGFVADPEVLAIVVHGEGRSFLSASSPIVVPPIPASR
jgi:enoyl-CoA hydratase